MDKSRIKILKYLVSGINYDYLKKDPINNVQSIPHFHIKFENDVASKIVIRVNDTDVFLTDRLDIETAYKLVKHRMFILYNIKSIEERNVQVALGLIADVPVCLNPKFLKCIRNRMGHGRAIIKRLGW